MLETVNKNSNYLCKVVQLKGVRKHSNADRLQVVEVGMNTVITGLDAKDGDIYVYFPIESKISEDFLSWSSSFRDKEKNADPSETGFFEANCRVRAMNLRGEKSMGYIVPARLIEQWSRLDLYIGDFEGQEFDTINGKLLVEKYEIVIKSSSGYITSGKKPNLSRLVEGQVNLHIKTKNLRHTPDAIKPEDTISITYKTHGTSWWVGNLIVKRKLSLLERLLSKFGVSISETVYDLVYGSRRVVKNKRFEDPKGKDHFYGYDLWEDIKNEVGAVIPKGWTLYGEMVGYDRNGGQIQKGYDYGCLPKPFVKSLQHKLEVYRITNTTPDGLVTELSFPEIREFCGNNGLDTPTSFFYGKAGDWLFENTGMFTYLDEPDFSFGKSFVEALQLAYNEKDCFMCTNKVPEEGVVIRKEKLIGCESYKLKSFRFLEMETKQLDKDESNIEDEN
jgi:hypothetical protein